MKALSCSPGVFLAAIITLGSSMFSGSPCHAAEFLADQVETGPEEVFFTPHEGVLRRMKDIPRPTAAQMAAARASGRASGLFNAPVYMDVVNGNAIGFDDPVFGAARRATMEAVLTYINSQLNYPANRCDVLVRVSYQDIGTQVLASAGTSYFAQNGFQPGSAALRIQTGTDPNGPTEEINVVVNFGYSWNSELDAPGNDEIDLFTVLVHEITHGLGVASLTSADGSSLLLTPPYNVNAFTSWDRLLFEANPYRRVWNETTFAFEATSLFEGDSTVVFAGTNAAAAFGSNPPVYSPGGFQYGSSISHWQLVSPIPANAVMRPSVGYGISNRFYQPFELQALKDLGYSLAMDVPVNPDKIYKEEFSNFDSLTFYGDTTPSEQKGNEWLMFGPAMDGGFNAMGPGPDGNLAASHRGGEQAVFRLEHPLTGFANFQRTHQMAFFVKFSGSWSGIATYTQIGGTILGDAAKPAYLWEAGFNLSGQPVLRLGRYQNTSSAIQYLEFEAGQTDTWIPVVIQYEAPSSPTTADAGFHVWMNPTSASQVPHYSRGGGVNGGVGTVGLGGLSEAYPANGQLVPTTMGFGPWYHPVFGGAPTVAYDRIAMWNGPADITSHDRDLLQKAIDWINNPESTPTTTPSPTPSPTPPPTATPSPTPIPSATPSPTPWIPTLTPSPTAVATRTPSADADSDKDGFSDDLESLYGSDPHDANSRPDFGDSDGDDIIRMDDALDLASRIRTGGAFVDPRFDMNSDGIVDEADARILYFWSVGATGFLMLPVN